MRRLHEAGYRTANIGKTHYLGTLEPPGEHQHATSSTGSELGRRV